MVDNPLFELDAERRWRLAYDGRQWILQRRIQKAHRRQVKGHAVRDSGFRGVWFVASKKATLVWGFRRFGVELTPEAQSLFHSLPDTFSCFRCEAWKTGPGGYRHVGWSDIDCGQ